VAADYAYQITKTPQAAIGKASRLLKEGKENEALDYFKEAIEMETNVAKKAKYAYVIAALYFKKGNTAACRQWCRETLKYNPSNGGAYLLQANCIARGAYGKSPKDVATSYYYCLASDYCNKAKAVDPSSAGKASRQAAAYAAHFYPKSEAFFAGIKAGQAVSCMGETTILRLR
jgi:tetratricopeptide (TPR) repeat protein